MAQSKEFVEESPTLENRYNLYGMPYGLSEEPLTEENPALTNRYVLYRSPYGFMH